MNDPRGSVWRKWDLHVHTPASFHWTGGNHFWEMAESEKEGCIKKILEEMGASDVVTFGIMDYWTFDGYLELKNYILTNNLNLNLTIFPGMEIRLEAPTDYRLNFHVLLSDKLTNQNLQDFKSKLTIFGTKNSLSDESIISYARNLDEDKITKHGFKKFEIENDDKKALCLGSKVIEITKESLQTAMDSLPQDSGILICPYDTSDGLIKMKWQDHESANYLLAISHIFETRDSDNIDLFSGNKTEKNSAFILKFIKALGNKTKPTISGSDAHSIKDYGNFPNGKATWIKADPTYKGLLQLINEPTRSFIGKLPPKLDFIQKNKTYFVDHMKINKAPNSKFSENWFNCAIPLNQDLVSIIGNKGSGKSALADIISLLGQTKQKHFSFLNETKFKSSQNKAKHFEAEITWKSGGKHKQNISELPDPKRVESIKYIPQNYFEILCSDPSYQESFRNELYQVIFSHLDEADRLDKNSLDELIDFRTKETNNAIQFEKNELIKLIDQLIDLETRERPEYKVSLNSKLELKIKEFNNHREQKPKPIEPPSSDISKNTNLGQLTKDLEKANSELTKVKKEIKKKTDERRNITKNVQLMQKLEVELENLKNYINKFQENFEQEYSNLNIKFSELVSVKINRELFEKKKTEINKINNENKELLNPENKNSLKYKENHLNEQKRELNKKLDEPNKQFQEYLSLLDSWKSKRAELIGHSGKTDSLKNLGQLIKDQKNLPQRIDELISKIKNQIRKIHSEKIKLKNIYSDLYRPVQKIIDEKELIKELGLNCETKIIQREFTDKFLAIIDQRAAGTFQGKEESLKIIKDILGKYDFDDTNDVVKFCEQFIENLHLDKRKANEPKNDIQKQIRQGRTTRELYEFIYSLDYLIPTYFLQLREKDLDQLSPGERGSLLLVFYLLVDKNPIPIVLDQPEENLDNQSIYYYLVPLIKEAKNTRQIIMVTHNPNLAIVCDSEQIIYAQRETTNNQISYDSGSIESEIINKAALDVLEGTRPAFRNRDSKYFVE